MAFHHSICKLIIYESTSIIIEDVTITSIPEAMGRSDSIAVAAIGGGVGGALVVIIILIIIVVVLILLVNSKRRADKPDQGYQGKA